MLDSNKLNEKLVSELREIAQNLGVSDTDSLRKQDLILKIIENSANPPIAQEVITVDSEVEGDSAEDKPRKR